MEEALRRVRRENGGGILQRRIWRLGCGEDRRRVRNVRGAEGAHGCGTRAISNRDGDSDERGEFGGRKAARLK